MYSRIKVQERGGATVASVVHRCSVQFQAQANSQMEAAAISCSSDPSIIESLREQVGYQPPSPADITERGQHQLTRAQQREQEAVVKYMGLASEARDMNALAQELSRRKKYYCPLGLPPDSVRSQSDSSAMKARTLALKRVVTAI